MAEETTLARAMLTLAREGRTGVLEARAEAIRTTIYVVEGLPVYADGGVLTDALGRVLVRQGLLTDDEYRAVLSRLAREDKRFGELVIALGLMTEAEVDAALGVQVRLKVVRCLGWERVTHTFEAGAERVKRVPRHPTRVEPLLVAAARMFDAARVEAALGPARGKFPLLRGYAEAIAGRFQIGTSGVRVLQRMDGSRTLDEILAATEEAAGAEAIVVALLGADELELLGAPRVSSIAPPPPSSRRAPRRPPPRLKPLPAVPKLAAKPVAVDRAAAVLARLNAARDVPEPSEPPPIEPPEGASAPARAYAAEHAFQAGKAHLRANRYVRALPLLQHAAELAPEVSEYLLYAAWTALRLAEGAAARDLAKALELVAQRALRDDAGSALAQYALAYLARQRGDAWQARGRFRQAQRLDPATLDAERHVRIVRRAPARRRRSSPPDRAPETTPSPTAALTATLVATPTPTPAAPSPLPDAPTPAAPLAGDSTPAAPLAGDSTPAGPLAGDSTPAGPLAGDSTRAGPSAGDSGARDSPAPIPVGAPVEARSLPDAARDAEPESPMKRAAAAREEAEPPGEAPRRSSKLARDAAIGFLVGAVAVWAILFGRAAVTSPSGAVATSATLAPPPAPPASAAPTVSASGPPPTTGALIPPASAKGHRIFVDGKPLGEGTDPLTVPCGRHVVRVGSSGKDVTLDVPCGGELTLE